MKILERFRRQKRGSVLALVVTLISLAVILIVAIMVIFNLQQSTSAMDLGTEGNATRDALFVNINTALSLTSIVPIIAVAGLIIGTVVAYLSFKRAAA